MSVAEGSRLPARLTRHWPLRETSFSQHGRPVRSAEIRHCHSEIGSHVAVILRQCCDSNAEARAQYRENCL